MRGFLRLIFAAKRLAPHSPAAKLWSGDRRHPATDPPSVRAGDRAAGAWSKAVARGRPGAGAGTARLQERAQHRRAPRSDAVHLLGACRAGERRAVHARSGCNRRPAADPHHRSAADPHHLTRVDGCLAVLSGARLHLPAAAPRAGSRHRRAGGGRADRGRFRSRPPVGRRPNPTAPFRRVSAEVAPPAREVAALVALLRTSALPSWVCADAVERAQSAEAVLIEEQGLLAPQLLESAAADVAAWRAEGMQLLTLLEPGYPENLRAVHDRPPLLFLRGHPRAQDARAVAVIGSRRATARGLTMARAIAHTLAGAEYTVVSGLAAGVDAAAHLAALEAGGRTMAVIGTGLRHAYPRQHAPLQRRIAHVGCVVSQFWPDAGPSPQNFPLRNALMSGISLATVVVEADQRSGARTQIRAALRHGRPVLLARTLLEQEWAWNLARRGQVHVIDSTRQMLDVLERLSATDQLQG